MALIIPQSNTPFQQVRKPRQSFDEPSIGEAVAGLADVAVSYGIDQNEHARAMVMQEARVTAAERLGALRDKYEQDPNLDGLSERFGADVEALKGELKGSLPKGRQQDQFDLTFRQMANPQVRAIGNRQYALQRDASLAQLNASLRVYQREAASAPDTQSRDAVLATAAEDIGAAKAAGWISATDAESILAGTLDGAVSNAAIEALQNDPQEFLDRRDDGEFSAMDPARLTALTGRAKSALAAEQVRLQKAAQVQAKEVAARLKADIENAVDVIEGGLRFDDLPGLMERAAGTEHEATLRATLAAAETEGNFAIIDPLDQQAVIAQLENTLTGDPEDIARLNRLRSINEKTRNSLENDQLSHVSKLGIVAVQPVAIDDPESMAARIATAEAVASDIKTDAPQLRYFTNPERDALQAEIQAGGPDEQLAIVTSIVENAGNRAGAILQEVGAQDPLFHLSGQLVLQSGDIAAARTMLSGRQLTRDKQGAKAPASARTALRAEFASAFPPADQARVAGLLEAADAHFAASGLAVDPDAGEDVLRGAYLKSIQAVSGQVVRRGVAYGGIQEVNGQQTLLPSTLSAEIVEKAIADATPETWAAASVTGGAPMLGGRPLPDPASRAWRRAGLDSARVLSMGGGRYVVGIERSDGTMRWLTDSRSANGLFYVDLEQLRGARQ
jgi:hypothetical protein